jgi:hypothetical protein
MSLKNDVELCVTRHKLRELEDRYQARVREKPNDPHIQELTSQSLKKLINQLKEEITLYEVHQHRGSQGWFSALPSALKPARQFLIHRPC